MDAARLTKVIALGNVAYGAVVSAAPGRYQRLMRMTNTSDTRWMIRVVAVHTALLGAIGLYAADNHSDKLLPLFAAMYAGDASAAALGVADGVPRRPATAGAVFEAGVAGLLAYAAWRTAP